MMLRVIEMDTFYTIISQLFFLRHFCVSEDLPRYVHALSGIKNLSAVLVTAKDLFGRTLLIPVQYAFTTITVHRTKLLMIGRNSVLLIQTSCH